MSNKQPEALRLAGELVWVKHTADWTVCDQAAAELRRLHAALAEHPEQEPVGVPQGWKLVPDVPTNEWINNLAKTQTGPLEDVPFADIYQCIAELLDTAPEAPQPVKRVELTDDDAPQPKADRADVPVWDEVYDCAVAAYCRPSTSKAALLRLCFQSRHRQHHIAIGWTANELMDFAKGIAALYTAPQPVKREPLTVDILPAALKGGVSAPEI